jgi:hypothetical protein
MKQLFTSIFIMLAIAAFAVGQTLSSSSSKFEINKAVEQLNTDVAAWNKRCKVTKTPAEEAWCKTERTRIDARKAELVALGAIPK